MFMTYKVDIYLRIENMNRLSQAILPKTSFQKISLKRIYAKLTKTLINKEPI